MLGDISGAERIFIACGYTDLRRGVDGLVAHVKQVFQLDPYANSLFLFCGRKADRIKGLIWEGDGFILLYKRLETGRYQWPRNANEAKEITWQQIKWLTEGLSIEQPKAIKKVTIKDII